MEHSAWQRLFDAVLVASGGNVESPVIELRVGPMLPYAISLSASSVLGAADVKLQVQASPDGTNFDAYADHADIVDSTLLAKPSGPELWNEYPLNDVASPFLKFKVTGVASNPADTLVSAKLLFRELV